MKHILSLFAVILFTTAVQADLQIVMREQSGHISTISSNGKQARIDDSNNSSYVLIDLKKNQLKMVDPRRREVMDMGGSGPTTTSSTPAASQLNIKLVKQGKGPKIAGYKTKIYGIQVNGNHCGTVFASKKVLKKKGVKKIFSAMQQLQQQSLGMAAGFRGLMDECTQADLQLSQSYKSIGAPMRMLDQQGQLESEVLRVNSKAKIPPGFYQQPADFQVTNMQQKMQQSQRAMQQMQGNMPDMNKLMQQMQQQEGMTPEALEQIKNMQEMFKKQYQQQ